MRRYHVPAPAAFAAAALLASATQVLAIGLGRLNVQSALGEPLRAEIDVSSLSPEESQSLRARVATPEAYRAAGVEFNAALENAQVLLSRRPDGRPYLLIQGERSLQEPFVDVILDLGWANGRLTREYTMLIDPPGRSVAATPAAQTAPVIGAAAPARPSATGEPSAAAPAAMSPATPPPAAAPPVDAGRVAQRAPAERPPLDAASMSRRARPESPAASAAATAPAGTASYRVRSGDTLSRIASLNAQPGVSLDQMLVALYRSNPQAFVGDNMNRLKAGAVLELPPADGSGQISAPDAHRMVQAQAADFSAYRQRLAGIAPEVSGGGASRRAGGRIEATVDDRRAAAATGAPDKLTLSQAGVRASAPESRLSQETERRAAETRVAELTRNVNELRDLTRPGAASAAAAPASAVPAPAPAPAPAPQPPVATAPVASAPPGPAPAAPPSPSGGSVSPEASGAQIVTTPVSLPPASAAAQTVAPGSSAPGPAVASASGASAAASASAAGEGWLADWLDGPYALPALVALLAALGIGGYAASRRRRAAGSETSFLESRLQADSFFGATGGQRVDTRDEVNSGGSASPSSLSYSLSQLDAIGDVDPVAEADVYLAYGRDLQAEEILKEALRGDSRRLAIRMKLLEVYAKRADAKAYEAQAREVLDLTRGEGEDWARVQEAGHRLDAENPLYIVGTDALQAAVIDGANAGDRSQAGRGDTLPPVDLSAPATELQPGPVADLDRLDLDLSNEAAGLTGAESTERMDLEATQPIRLDAMTPSPSPVDRGASLDFDLDTGKFMPAPPPPELPTQRLDFGDLSLDLPDLAGEPPPAAPAADPSPAPGGEDDALSRKLELADEFRRIGDLEGARDLLEEVVAKADGAMKAKAEGMLRDLE